MPTYSSNVYIYHFLWQLFKLLPKFYVRINTLIYFYFQIWTVLKGGEPVWWETFSAPPKHFLLPGVIGRERSYIVFAEFAVDSSTWIYWLHLYANQYISVQCMEYETKLAQYSLFNYWPDSKHSGYTCSQWWSILSALFISLLAFSCSENFSYQACISACDVPSTCQNSEPVPWDSESCLVLTESCVCAEGNILHRVHSALCIPEEKCSMCWFAFYISCLPRDD